MLIYNCSSMGNDLATSRCRHLVVKSVVSSNWDTAESLGLSLGCHESMFIFVMLSKTAVTIVIHCGKKQIALISEQVSKENIIPKRVRQLGDREMSGVPKSPVVCKLNVICGHFAQTSWAKKIISRNSRKLYSIGEGERSKETSCTYISLTLSAQCVAHESIITCAFLRHSTIEPAKPLMTQ